MKPPCAMAGCSKRSVHRHHAIKAQTIKRAGGFATDARWLIPLCHTCHGDHHGTRPLSLSVLPDCVFEVARETFGAGRAYEELRRAYQNGPAHDPRLDALLDEWEARDAA